MQIKATLYMAIALSAISFLTTAQQVDTIYNQQIKIHTTDSRFLPSSVLNLELNSQVPSPLRYFGSIIGAPGVMHTTKEIYGYYQKLAASSPLLKMFQVSTTEEGRPIYQVVIASNETHRQMAEQKKKMALLADPRKISSGEAETLIETTRPVFYLNGGLHSPEMGSPEMLMELAYRLITSSSPGIRNILDRLVVVINPVAEPDGRDKQVDWYYRYTKARNSFDDGFPRSAPYWGKYIYHDNNRDGIQVSQALTNAIFDMYYEWHPTVMLDLHESVPLIYMSTGTGPYNETIDPITIGEWQVMANHDITSLASEGLPGAFTWAFYDGWYPGYGIWVANNHNSIGRFYETFGNAGANTYLRDLSDSKYAGDPVTSREWYRPDPATPQVYWSSRNNINYMQAGVLASLTYTADNARQLLKNFYQKGVNNIVRGKKDKPASFVIPANQADPAMVAYLVNQLRRQQIEVHQVDTGRQKNDYVVLLDQPYRNLAVSLLTKQSFPKEAKFPPYDDIAWTLGYLYGVTVRQEDSVAIARTNLRLISSPVEHKGNISGSGSSYVLKYVAQQKVLAAAYSCNKKYPAARMSVIDDQWTIATGKDSAMPGSVYWEGLSTDQAKELSQQFGLDLQQINSVPSTVRRHALKLPRVAIYHSWYNTQDEGWSRYTFEQMGVPYTSINKDDLKKGELKSRFDVILIPRTSGTASDFINEIDNRFGPMPYTKTAAYPSHGYPDSTLDMTGGPGFAGLAQLRLFAEQGGLIVSLDNSTRIMAETGLADGLDLYDAAGLFHPGSIVMAKARQPGSPVLNGFPPTFPIFRGNGPLLQVRKYDRTKMLLQYGTKPLKDELPYAGPVMGMPEQKKKSDDTKSSPEGPYLISGMVRNEAMIIGHGAIFQLPIGKGGLIGFTFDPLHRFLNLHEAPLVWNCLLNWDQLIAK
ncbi:MAG: M14 family zinc carboxypeptidase [Sediminibacterium sp.]